MNNNQQLNQNMQMGSGLTRYRSAPSSYLLSLLRTPSKELGCGGDDAGQVFDPRGCTAAISVDTPPPPPLPPPGPSRLGPHFLPSPKTEPSLQPSNDFPSGRQRMMIHESYNTSQDDSLEKFWDKPIEEMKMVTSDGGGLIRHSSSPAGLFADIDLEIIGGSFGVGANPQFPPVASLVSDTGGNNRFSWEDSSSLILSDDLLAGFVDDDGQKDDQIKEAGKPPTPSRVLSRHLSLPKESMEKLLQDSVRCKVRARRGCATHPRSIAERVRRTKISQRMRRLQELVPNMDKQTNTSDMLELAVDYIKDLQRQVQTLRQDRDRCSCSGSCSAEPSW